MKPLPVDVTAVLVAHDGAAWLPQALRALAASTRTPARVICVDTGSTDGSAELLEAAFGEVLRLPRDTGFGAAVAAGLAQAPPTEWLWLLHDDCAVEPTTLQALLDHAETSPSAALLGPKVRDWSDPHILVEVGLTTDAAGHRETGLERREYDQGQHDVVRDVLAVGTAAALVRRDVWNAVGGIDPALPVFRDDLDLGWKINAAGHRVVVVPEARIRHARAATTGHRETDAAPGRATGIDRKHALFVLLAHAGLLRLLTLVPRLLLSTAARALGLLLTRQLPDAGDEVRALASAFGHPGRLLAARRARAATRTVSTRQLRPLFASRTVRIRAHAGALADWLSGGSAPGVNPLGALGDPGPDGPDELAMAVSGGSGTLRRALMRPGVLLVLGLSVVTLIAERSVLTVRGGTLAGGHLLPVPEGARDLWAAYLGAWHQTSVGSGRAAPPGTALLAGLSSVLLGKPALAIDLLLLASVPLAGLTAYLAAGRLVRHLYLRLWAAATWALLPVATGAIAAGRLDAAAVQIALPLLVVAGGRVLHDDPQVAGWWRAWALGFGLAVTAAFAPLLWPLSVLVLLVGAAVNLTTGDGGRRRALSAVIAGAVPAAVLFPWSLQALQQPSLFLVGSTAADAALPAWHLLLLSPGGPGVPALLFTGGLLLAAVGGTLREEFRGLALAAWGVALVGLFAAMLLSRARVEGMPVWPGIALQLSAITLLVAALVAGTGLRSRLARSSFGWRQLLAASIAVAAVAAPVLAAGAWMVRGADDPLRRDLQPLLVRFASAELEASPGLRVLVLSAQDGRLHYALTDAAGTRLSTAGIAPEDSQRRALDAVVADLASPRGSDAAEALSTRAVRYVALRDDANGAFAAALDAQPGLVRRTSGEVVLWQVLAPSTRLSVLPPKTAEAARSGSRAPTAELLRVARPTAVPAGREGASAALTAGPEGRLLVLAEASDSSWRATVDGKPLTRRTAWGWAQGFELPAAGGRLELDHAQGGRQAALSLQAVLLLIVAVLSVPGARRRRGLEEDFEELPDDHVAPAPPARPVVVMVSGASAVSAKQAASTGLRPSKRLPGLERRPADDLNNADVNAPDLNGDDVNAPDPNAPTPRVIKVVP